MKPLPPYLDNKPILAGARKSPLSQVQYQELLNELKNHFPSIQFTPIFVDTKGDKDKITSLRILDKTDFFTKEIDEMLLKGECRIGIHSAKDLPDPIPKGLEIVAVTKGIDPSDSLVLRSGETLTTLPKNGVIATSSLRREEAVSQLRSDFRFIDLRGTIGERLQKLETGEADGVVVAEAALIRLGLTHLNRVTIPGGTTPAQGQLAVVAREGDHEIKTLFAALDVRPKSLYLGLEPPSLGDALRIFLPFPLIQIVPKEVDLQEKFPAFLSATHLLFTSKTAVRLFFSNLEKEKVDWAQIMKGKKVIVVGRQTARAVESLGIGVDTIAEEETAEGILKELNKLSLEKSSFFWPHSSLSRPLIRDWFQKEGKNRGTILLDMALYDTVPYFSGPLPNEKLYHELFFTSPSTVEAFFTYFRNIPEGKKVVAIGPVTEAALRTCLKSKG